MDPAATATWQAGQEALERFIFHGRSVQEYYTLLIVIGVGSLALVVIFVALVYLNRDALRRRLRYWLNK